MRDALGQPEVRFHVSEVRVSIWPKPTIENNTDDQDTRAITIDRQTPAGTPGTGYTNVLHATDIAKAILALKKAHHYLEKTQHANVNTAEYEPASLLIRERIP